MAVQCFELLRPFMPEIMPELVAQLYPEPKPEEVSACNNAAWSVGEVALRYGAGLYSLSSLQRLGCSCHLLDPQFAQWVPGLVHRLIPCLLHPKAPRSLHENAAVTLGRIGLILPTAVAPQLEVFAEQWYTYRIFSHVQLDNHWVSSGVKLSLRSEITKKKIPHLEVFVHSSRLIPKELLKYGPPPLLHSSFHITVQSFFWFCNAIAQWGNPTPELNDMFKSVC